MRSILLLVAATVALSGLTACNTVRGVGEDISALGNYLARSSGTSPAHGTPPPSSF
jgi:predicted small secreted protein